MDYSNILEHFSFDKTLDGDLSVFTPINGTLLARVQQHKVADVNQVADNAQTAFHKWRAVPAPVRGEFVRILGNQLRKNKDKLGALVSLECGKVLSEGLGEVQEMIDICDFAVGLSRQIGGLTLPSERPGHHMRETWHPLGPVGIISAFNFPVAVWCWNAALALVCGNSIVWKPSEKTPLTAMASQMIFEEAVKAFKDLGHDVIPEHLSQLLIGGRDIGQELVNHRNFVLISATGSTEMGRQVGRDVAMRFGKTILELGGNNATIVMPSIDLDEDTLSQIAFGAVGTAGQRCTTLRRLIIHDSIYDDLIAKLQKVYRGVSQKIGSPLEPGILVGPVIDQDAVDQYFKTIEQACAEGGKLIAGGQAINPIEGGFYVEPALIEMPEQTSVVQHETFVPILYLLRCKNLEEGISMNNSVPQGLSSSIMTNDVREAEYFLSYAGSDCGIANVNIGTSGAEIGGAFGGEKETGGGRESGSDSWKSYMRRQTNTIRYAAGVALAQGVSFDV